MNKEDEESCPDDGVSDSSRNLYPGRLWAYSLKEGDCADAETAGEDFEEHPASPVIEKLSGILEASVEVALPEEGVVLRVVVGENDETREPGDIESEADEERRCDEECVEYVGEQVGRRWYAEG